MANFSCIDCDVPVNGIAYSPQKSTVSDSKYSRWHRTINSRVTIVRPSGKISSEPSGLQPNPSNVLFERASQVSIDSRGNDVVKGIGEDNEGLPLGRDGGARVAGDEVETGVGGSPCVSLAICVW